MNPRESILTRLYVVTALLMLLPAGVVFQMVKIHLGEGAELRARGERQASSFVELPAVRGSIYDRAGRALAVSTARYEVAVDPSVPGFDAKAEELYDLLARATGRPAGHFRRLVRDRTSPKYVLLVRALDEAAKAELDAADVPGLIVDGTVARRYNYGRLASHVLGHVDADLRGIAGLEQQYDAYLRGEPGRRAVQRDRRGVVKAVVGGAVVEPKHGEHLVLTIDLVRQAILEEELARGVAAAGARWGTAIAMDPRTGAILALANVPDYDPNSPGGYAEAARRNHAITDRIEPGSTFKLVTAVAALETGTVSPEDTVDAGPGWAVIRGRTMRDSHAYGRLTFGDAIAVSSNVAMARTALEMEPADLYRYARALGFGSPSWVDLPGEVTGRLKRPSEFGRLTLPWMATGYEVSATPLQILTAYCALANGGLLVQPYVVAERRDARGRTVWRVSEAHQDSVRRAFSEETAARLVPHFERVVSRDGTARRAAVEGLRIAGKTGTAQTAAGGGYTHSYRATFVGFFPVEAPEVALIVVLDGPQNGYYGGSVSAPIFGAIARRWIGTFPSIAARVAPAAPLPERAEAPVPDVDGMPAVLAEGRLLARGFPVRADDDAPWAPVAEQDPAPGDRADVRHAVRLVAAPAGVSAGPSSARPASAPAGAAMPDLRGLSARRAVAWLAALGVEARLVGSGAVTAQSPAAGSALPAQAVLTLQ
ncbi:MAG TPA: penicillin-binding transpeptidase domain-containing protein [Rubricoccaceae bacterium]|nr:penicillin-binding transpeptidase domain-containing protein [Rubricoccaceae bacterium]